MIGAFNPRDAHHTKARPILEALVAGKLGRVLITDHIFGEVTTYLRKKVGPESSCQVAEAMLDSEHLEVAFVNEDIFNAAYHIFRRYERLAFTDAASVVVYRNRRASGIFSFDRGFDAVRNMNRLETIP